jgi:hypothetical protein
LSIISLSLSLRSEVHHRALHTHRQTRQLYRIRWPLKYQKNTFCRRKPKSADEIKKSKIIIKIGKVDEED